MDLSKIYKSLSEYENKKSSSFNYALNKLVDDLSPNLNVDEYGDVVKKNKNSDLFYREKILENNLNSDNKSFEKHLGSFSKSNGSTLLPRIDYRIGMITDEKLYNIFKQSANLSYISSSDIDLKSHFDLVIVSSLIEGIDGSWKKVTYEDTEKHDKLISYLKYLKVKNIPTVFIYDESEIKIDDYLSIIIHCDLVFTNNEQSINHLYKKTSKETYLLENLINPLIYNPIGVENFSNSNTSNKMIYTDFWNSNSIQKQTETENMLKKLVKSNADIHIYDEMLFNSDIRYQFPNKYINNIYQPIDDNNINKFYLWSIFISGSKYTNAINSTKLFENLAMGNLVISNYNKKINNDIPSVKIVHDVEDINQLITLPDGDKTDLRAKNIRHAMYKNNSFIAMRKILNYAGLGNFNINPSVLIVLNQDSEINRQSFNNQFYKNKKYVLKSEIDKVIIEDYDFITFFDEKYVYEEYYIDDLLTGFMYTDSNYVGKYNSEKKYNYINKICSEELTLFKSDFYINRSKLDDEKGFNLDSSEIILKTNQKSGNTTINKKVSVIVPIHNNGRYLEEKCYASLKRSSSFNKMEIIFVNDGSTDDFTNQIIKRIIRRSPDIVYYEFDNGSGSASRPRNKGVELATTDYITYLDPDNEALGDGYHHLLEVLENEEVDIVIGNIISEHNNKRDAGRYSNTVKKVNNNSLYVDNPRKLLIESAMKVQSIQAMIINKKVIKKNKIKMIEGAAGQDTMFFQEVLLNSKSLKAVEKFIHVYYADVSGSVTNTLSKTFFDKYYILELKRLPFLKNYKILDVYLKEIFNYYLRNWYFKKLELVSEKDRVSASARLLEIINLYSDYRNFIDTENRNFINKLYVEQMNIENNLPSIEVMNIVEKDIEMNNTVEIKVKPKELIGFTEQIQILKGTSIVLEVDTQEELEKVEQFVLELKDIRMHISARVNYNLFEFLNKDLWTKNVIIKHLKINENSFEVNCFYQNKITETNIINNVNILMRSVSRIENNKSLYQYTAKQALRLSENLVNEINNYKLTKKELEKLIEKL